MSRRQTLITAFLIDAICWSSVGSLFAYFVYSSVAT